VSLANLPRHIANRELDTLRAHLPGKIHKEHVVSSSPSGAGNALLIELQFEHVTEIISEVGEKGRPAEAVAQAAAQAAQNVCVPVGACLADQLLLPLALGGGEIRATTLTPHFHTNAVLIGQFADDPFSVTGADEGWKIETRS